ncbi:copper-binding protein [Rhodoferax sp.]|uniref:copper-binding protein n=1 Tax=Rhodoferax sp. TaxID=50421 RepID=UPI001EC49C82|nr:copper-binding protein [Rhodoferax sp.]MBT9508633.1 copper-binding protein [Rhodoferax sp.]
MRTFIASVLIVLASTGFSMQAMAQTDHSSHGGPAAMQMAAAEMPLAEGVVKKIDKSTGRVTLSHGPLPGGMPAMTMAYRVKDVAWLNQMKEGQKIRFATDPADGGMTVVRFESVK